MFQFKKGVVILTLVLLSCALFGCGGSVKQNETTGAASSDAAEKNTKQAAAGAEQTLQTRVVKDAKGEVEIPAHPLRIADISGSTEELLILGYQPILTGNTANPLDMTPILKEKLKGDLKIAGWFQTPVNIEAVAAAEPDLILAGPTQDTQYEELQKIAPAVAVPYGFNAFRDRFSFVAEVFDKKQVMEAWMKEYDDRAQQLHDQIAAVTKDETFAVIEATPKEIRIYSSTGVVDMIFNDIKLPKAPGRPEPDGWGGKVTSLEGLSSLNPDHLILLFESENNVLEDSKLWEGLKAVKSGNVYRMTSRQNYNEAFTAWDKKAVLEQIASAILQKPKS
ncbi:ABC transporter substrate-binding protein [Paenibacillus apiarius]|uniref:ABC transporter substrate-binding protein n=1 Tax=Paenibacillus apiarius TaxID=46240 RepID=UPI00197D7B37|nr:ABC transporter substrate-binding protein [Paenibacillus apiarius]MBN3526729.1 ABC transporter substrate-binding protein [Paenibacillus apiarius]